MLSHKQRQQLIALPFPVVQRFATSYPHGGTQVQDMDSFFACFRHHKSGEHNDSLGAAIRVMEDEVFDSERL